jgi:hypothetical protein
MLFSRDYRARPPLELPPALIFLFAPASKVCPRFFPYVNLRTTQHGISDWRAFPHVHEKVRPYEDVATSGKCPLTMRFSEGENQEKPDTLF